jgi:hypothetical protein
MGEQLIDYLLSLDGYAKVEAQLLQTCELTAHQDMLLIVRQVHKTE